MISSYIDYASNQLASIYDPMSVEPIDINETIFSDKVNPLNAALLPVQYSFKMNMAISTYRGFSSAGLFSNISDPFNRDSYIGRRTSAYNAARPGGFVGGFARDIARSIGNLGEQKEKGLRSALRQWGEKLEGDNLKAKILENFEPGFIEKQLLPKGDFEALLNKIDPELKDKLGGEKGYSNFLKKVVDSRSDKPTPKDWNSAVRNQLGMDLSSDINIMKKHRAQNTYSIFNMLSGKRDGVDFRRRDALAQIIGTDPDAPRLSLYSRGGSKITNRSATAVHEGLRAFLQEGGVNIDVGTDKMIKDYASLSASRLTKLRFLKGAAWIGTAAMASIPLAATALRTYMTVPAQISSTMEKINRVDFGSGEVLHNSSIATERQRALMAIRDSQLNARSIMGNEASFMH